MSESLKELSRLLVESKSKITDLNSQSRAETAIKEDLEFRLISAMNAVDLDSFKNDCGSFSLKESIVPSEVDWDVFHQWVINNDAMYLLQRRISVVEYKKLIEMGEEVPGVTPYNRVTVGTRKPADT